MDTLEATPPSTAPPSPPSARTRNTLAPLRSAAEIGIVVAVVLVVQAHAYFTQGRIDAADERGYDGVFYHEIAEQLAAGEPPSGEQRFVRRIGTPLLAVLVNRENITDGFVTVNAAASVLSAVLLLVWLRTLIRGPWLRIGLVALYATHWLQTVRFTFFYPGLVDPWTQVCCFAGLIGVSRYERAPGRWPAVAVALVSVVGVCFREVALLIPVAFLFARNPRIEHLHTFPYARIANAPRFEQWVPLVLSFAALAGIDSFVIATDDTFSAAEHLSTRAFDRNLIVYLLGWLIAFGPALYVVLFDRHTVVEFFSRHKAMTVYVAGVAVIAWAGSLESERHALNSASPILYALLGRTIERHPHWFRSATLVTFLIAAQMLVHRAFLSTPESGTAPERTPAVLLTPIGSDVTYLHLFPDYIPMEMVLMQAGQFVVLGVIVVVWLKRRAWLERTASPPAVHYS